MSQNGSDSVSHDRIREQIETADHDEEFNHEMSNTVDMVLKAYKKLWHPIVFEGNQNSMEGWLHNTGTGVIPERQLRIRFAVDTEAGTITWEDNAGGMTPTKLDENFLGLDTPGEEKQDGDMNGGYGRGSVAFLALGDYFYVETRHDGDHVAATGEVIPDEKRVNHSEPAEENAVGELDVQGTHVTLHDVHPDVLEGLDDDDAVRQAVVEKFPGMLERDDVEIEFVVDGEPVEFPDIDLDALREEADSWTVEELPAVRAKGESRRVRNLHVVDARDLDGEAPWKGVLLLKADKYSEEPWMAIDDYNPNGVRALSDEEMFAWADVSEFCPDCEDAGHEGFVHVAKADMGIKGELRELNRKHFRPDADEQREQMENEAKKELNHLLSEHAEGIDLDRSAGGSGSGGSSYTGPDRVRVRHPGDGVTAGDSFAVEIDVDAKNADVDTDAVEVYHVTVRDSQTGETVAELDGETVSAGAKTTVERTATVPDEGRYSVTAWLREAGGDRIDKSHATLSVGDADPVLPTGESDGFDYVENVEALPFPAEWEGRRHAVQRNDDGELEVYVNENWPAFAKTFDWGTKKRNTEQKALLVRIGVEAVFEWMIENPTEVGRQRQTLKQMRDEMKRRLWEKYGDNGSVEVAF